MICEANQHGGAVDCEAVSLHEHGAKRNANVHQDMICEANQHGGAVDCEAVSLHEHGAKRNANVHQDMICEANQHGGAVDCEASVKETTDSKNPHLVVSRLAKQSSLHTGRTQKQRSSWITNIHQI